VRRLLLDQGLPRSSAILLTEAGWDVVHVADIGMSRSDDSEILRRAQNETRVCVTLDADFHSLLVSGGDRGPSVIRIRKEGLDATALAALLQGIWSGIEDALEEGAMVTVRSARCGCGGCRLSESEMWPWKSRSRECLPAGHGGRLTVA
jgi:predicted nuclease of predicted toxin-antitoxin system